jgi:hypothetical protein
MMRETAEKIAKEMNDARERIYCPYIRGMCRINCELYSAAAATKVNNGNDWGHSIGHCLFTKAIMHPLISIPRQQQTECDAIARYCQKIAEETRRGYESR